jgi:dinuclear metal center YbgI/SA1388 family protein
MSTVADVAAFLEHFAPPRLAEEWDNVGLLVGDRSRAAERVMTCLTITPASAAEAIDRRVELIVTHHPLPFAALRRLTADTTPGRLLLELIAAGIAVYSPHTAFDSAQEGINQQLANGLKLRGIVPLRPHPQGQGTGRWGWLEDPLPLAELARRVMSLLNTAQVGVVGRPEQAIRTVAVACGAADELLDAARENGCDCLVVGEARFHTCLEAEATGMGLILPGHFASERFAVERLAEVLGREFPALQIWPSRSEKDPIEWIEK